MKLSKLFKKVSVAVSVLMIAGMLAACSSPSGGSSSGSGSGDGNGTGNGGTPTQQGGTTDNGGSTSQPGGTTGKDGESGKDKNTTTGEYTVKYDGLVIETVSAEDLEDMPDSYGTVSGKEVIATSAYPDAMIAMASALGGETYVAVVYYEGEIADFLTQADFESAGSLLTENTDYQISSDNKVIVLTDSGAQKMQVSGNNSSSEHSDSTEKEGKIVFTYTDGGLVSEFRMDAKSCDSWVSYYELIKDTDYVMDATGKKGTLPKSGDEKTQAKSKKN